MLRREVSASVDRLGRLLVGPAWLALRGQVMAHVERMPDAEVARAVRAIVAEADALRGLLR